MTTTLRTYLVTLRPRHDGAVAPLEWRCRARTKGAARRAALLSYPDHIPTAVRRAEDAS